MTESGGEASYQIEDSLAGERVDVALSRLVGMSRTKAGQLISDGLVLINGRRASRSDKLEVGSVVNVSFPTMSSSDGQEDRVDLDILHVDDDIVVVNKPVGIAAHASPGWSGPTLTGQLPLHGVSLSQLGPQERQGIVHRLDVGTSGVMVLARSDRAYLDLKDQFRSREVRKIYHTLVQGHPDPPEGTINAPIGRHPQHDHRFAVTSGGKPSVTNYRTLDAFAYASLLEIDLKTGRTHQIRVHMSAMRHPCCGDLTYGADPVLSRKLGLNRQWLHAHKLDLRHPGTGERCSFSGGYPPDLQRALDVLGH